MTDPRNISPRTDAFLATLGPYIAALEKASYDCPFLVKGLNLPQRHSKMTPLLSFKHFLEIDYSRFDMTLSAGWLREVEETILTYNFPEEDHPMLYKALKLARNTYGIADNGWFYKVSGTRCSGDAHTSIANGLINAFNTWVTLRHLPLGAWTSFHEGDDGIIGVAEEFVGQAHFLTQNLASAGFTVKLLYHDSLELASFCGRFFAEVDDKLTSYCDPIRTLAKFNTTLSALDSKQLLRAKALSYHHTDGRTPIIGQLCRTIIKLTEGVKMSRAVVKTEARNRWHHHFEDLTTYNDITTDERLRGPFALRTGWFLPTQQKHEAMVESWETLGFIPREIPYLVTDVEQEFEKATPDVYKSVMIWPDQIPLLF